MKPLLSLVLLCAALGSAQAAVGEGRAVVTVVHSGEDALGVEVVTLIRKAISLSDEMRLLEGPSPRPRITLHVASLDGSTSNPGSVSALSAFVVYTEKSVPGTGYLLNGYMSICVQEKMKDCAAEFLQALVEGTDRLKKENAGLHRRLFWRAKP